MEELTITVFKDQLLLKLEMHRKRFVKSYDALLKAYERKAKKFQEKYGHFVEKVLTKEGLREQPIAPFRPRNRTEDYDLYIGMIKIHTEATVELTDETYRKLWMDKWQWMDGHIDNLQVYANADASVETALALYSN